MTEPRAAKCAETLVTLRDHFESQCAAHQRATDLARELMEARLARAEIEMERRLDGLNHLRDATLSKTEFTAAHAALTSEFHAEAATLRAEVAGLKEWKAEQRGKASVSSVYLSYVLAIIGLVLSAIALAHELMQATGGT